MKVGEAFSFEEPAGWAESRNGSQHIFTGPNGEVLIVSGSALRGPEGPELEKAAERAKEDVLQVIRDGAKNPELREMAPLARWKEITHLEAWWQHNVTHDNLVVFSQLAMVSGRGVLLATLESPSSVQEHPRILGEFAMRVNAIG